MNRLLRSVAIGAGGAGFVGGALYLLEQQKIFRREQPVYLPKEWAFDTRQSILKAGSTDDPAKRASYYDRALSSIINSRTDIRTKSQSWVTGYGDLLRAYAIALAESRDASDEEVMEPLKAASTVPYGNSQLKAAAASLAYKISGDSSYLLLDEPYPPKLETEAQIKAWAPLEIEIAKKALSELRYSEAMNTLLALHRSFDTSAADPLCLQASTGGYIAQILWKLNRQNEARKWLEISEKQAAKCGTPACRETTDTLRNLLARTTR